MATTYVQPSNPPFGALSAHWIPVRVGGLTNDFKKKKMSAEHHYAKKKPTFITDIFR
jgi:hypothetical protein